jgi:hypothetical protein
LFFGKSDQNHALFVCHIVDHSRNISAYQDKKTHFSPENLLTISIYQYILIYRYDTRSSLCH